MSFLQKKELRLIKNGTTMKRNKVSRGFFKSIIQNQYLYMF
jgi:hypothetical protein